MEIRKKAFDTMFFFLYLQSFIGFLDRNHHFFFIKNTDGASCLKPPQSA